MIILKRVSDSAEKWQAGEIQCILSATKWRGKAELDCIFTYKVWALNLQKW